MYELKTIIRLLKRGGLAAFAIAMLLSLTALPAPAQTPTQVGDYIFLTGDTVELAKGHTIRVHYDTGWGNRIAIRGSVKVFGGSSGALLQTQELTSSTAGLYSVDIKRDDLREEGEPDTGRLQLWIVAAINWGSAGTPESGVWVVRSTFELLDHESSTTVSRGVWKTTNFLTTDGQIR